MTAPGRLPAPGSTAPGPAPGDGVHGAWPGPGPRRAAGDLRPPAGDGPRRRGRRWTWPAAVGTTVVACLLVSALFLPRSTAGDLDTDSAAPRGTRALARILRRGGTDVRQVRRSTELAAASRAARLLVVVHPQLRGPQQLRRIARSPADLLLVEPDSVVLDALAPRVLPHAPAPDGDPSPDCDLLPAVTAGRITGGGTLYRSTGQGTLCYPGDDGTSGLLLTERTAAPGSPGARTVTVLGQADVLRNEHLAGEGNAALALGLLGGADDVTWYLPDPQELSGDEAAPSLLSLVPDRVGWSLVHLAAVLVLVLLWRGRRMGPLVHEPLPVVVRGAEVQEGRARLYLRAGARPQAAAALRTAALRRTAARLNLPRDSTVEQVIDAVAAAAGLPPHEVARVMAGPSPSDDGELVRLAERLDALENALADPGPVHGPTSHRKADSP